MEPDIADRASIETDRSLELRTRDRARKLIVKIDEALERIEKGSYGYCLETSEPITLSRLEARPIALCPSRPRNVTSGWKKPIATNNLFFVLPSIGRKKRGRCESTGL